MRPLRPPVSLLRTRALAAGLTGRTGRPGLAGLAGLASVVIAFGACAGERLPAMDARPTGIGWFCAQGSWSACGRTREDCPRDNSRIGSRVVAPGELPKPAECVEQPSAVCYTYVSPTAGKTLYDCLRDRIECEGYRREAARSPAEHKDLSVCSSWD